MFRECIGPGPSVNPSIRPFAMVKFVHTLSVFGAHFPVEMDLVAWFG